MPTFAFPPQILNHEKIWLFYNFSVRPPEFTMQKMFPTSVSFTTSKKRDWKNQILVTFKGYFSVTVAISWSPSLWKLSRIWLMRRSWLTKKNFCNIKWYGDFLHFPVLPAFRISGISVMVTCLQQRRLIGSS
jgi:hypothetical protein